MNKQSFECVVFDLDGIITKTARVHAKAWKETFDEYLKMREKRNREPFREFTHDGDYLPYVDGKPRYEGVKSFLESRNINLRMGDPKDEPDKETVCGIGNRKNDMFRQVLARDGAEVYESTVEFIKELKKNGVRVGLASSSKNCLLIIQKAGIEDLFESRVDGEVSVELGLKGKPEGDIFVTACRKLGAEPARSVVVEDATSGVQAGRNGGFGLVLGVARQNNELDLLQNGADVVVRDLKDISTDWINKWFHRKPRPLYEIYKKYEKDVDSKDIILNPCYSRNYEAIFNTNKMIILFLDYDGTLTPIVERPELAVLNDQMREVLRKLMNIHKVAIVSGRQREDVEDLVKIDGLTYAGSHGFDIKGPGLEMVEPRVKNILPTITQISDELDDGLSKIEGVIIERKKFSVAVHYRLVDPANVSAIKEFMDKIMRGNKGLRVMSGKKVFEILPDIEWDKGKAVRWILEAINVSWTEASCVYIGDDVTDEFAFRAIRTRGAGILVSDKTRDSAAEYLLSSPEEVKGLFEKIIKSI